MLGPLCQKLGRFRSDRADRRTRRCDGDYGCRPRGGEADPADAAQVQLRADQPAGAGDGCRAFRRRADRGRGRADPGGGRGHCRSRHGRDRRDAGSRRCARGAGVRRSCGPSRGGRQCRRRRAGEDRRIRRNDGRGAPAHQDRHSIASAECTAVGAARGACGMGSEQPAGDAQLCDPDAARDADDHRRADRDAGIGSAGDRSGCRRRVRAENVAGARIRGRDLARPQASDFGRMVRGPARESHRLFSQPRPAHRAGRRLRRRRQTGRVVGGYSRQCRRLFVLPDDLRRRAVDGDGRDARSLRRARICVYLTRSRDPYLSDGAVSRRLPSGDHLHHRAADGQGGGCFRPRSDRDPPP